MKNLFGIFLFLFFAQTVFAQDSTTISTIQKMDYEHWKNSIDTTFFLSQTVIQQSTFYVEPVYILDSTNWNGVYVGYLENKIDTGSGLNTGYCIYYNGELYYQLFKNKPHHHEQPLRIYKILRRKYGADEMKMFEGYFFWRSTPTF